jgi:tRNA threonylcarbamoyladenosine biosynthesis protein TsaE
MVPMNSVMTYEISTTGADKSLELGEKIGRFLKGGQVIELVSDLGGGKTVLVKGIARGLGYSGEVTSPTFTISRVYRIGDDLELAHFDFYRLGQGDIAARELAEVIGDPAVIVAVEWADNAGPGVLPDDRLRIGIRRIDDQTRRIVVEALGPVHRRVVEGLK